MASAQNRHKTALNADLERFESKRKLTPSQIQMIGPIQKLTVPDFQHINSVFEQMQSEILEKPSKARKQMKPFTIRKATQPGKGAPAVSHDASAEASQKYATAPAGDRGEDRYGFGADGAHEVPAQDWQNAGDIPDLTPEEIARMQPKKTKVINPWIHEQTHQEYLENITGLPARHANVIKKHKTVVKETTFLPKPESNLDKDKATKEALAILDKEYEIFNDPHMLPVKALPRYDCWEVDRTVEEWLEHCREHPDVFHGVSPIFEKGEYLWRPVKVIDYDYKEKKYKVQVSGDSKQIKLITRLSLLFYDEDPEVFKKRVNECKQRQRNVEAELRFTQYVDSLPTDSVSTLSKQRRDVIMNKSLTDNHKFNPELVYKQFTELMRVVQEEYIRQMKKCIVLKQMQDPMNNANFIKLKVPIRLRKKTAPYFGVVRCPKYKFGDYQNEILHVHWCSDKDMEDITRIFTAKCIDYENQRFLNTNKGILKLPNELKELKAKQESHHKATTQNIMHRWREYLVGEIVDKLKNKHNFFEENESQYEQAHLKRIVMRFEFILNSFLRSFVKNSIDDWINFVRSFTNPKYHLGELWQRSQTPLLTINLNYKRPEKDKRPRRKKIDETLDPEAYQAELDARAKEDEEYMTRLEYSPSLETCHQFLQNALNMIIESTNAVSNLETDLMSSLQFQKKSNFPIDLNFPWMQDASQHITNMFNENIVEPLEILSQYKKYEYLLNVDRNQLVDSLFANTENPDGPKVAIDAIRQQILIYHTAAEEILNLSNDSIDTPLFRVQATKIKKTLSEAALKVRDKLIESVKDWCNNNVNSIQDTYYAMQERIRTIPTNEKELVSIREFIKVSRDVTQVALQEQLKEVNKHWELLDEFSYEYQHQDIELTLMQKMWPMQIGNVITDGNSDIQVQEETFSHRLDKEKDEFAASLIEYEAKFKKIITFESLKEIPNFVKDAFDLKNLIENAKDKIQQFNEREETFSQQKSEWPKLDELEKSFKPFYDLLDTGFQVTQQLADWTNQPLVNQDYDHMENSISGWSITCIQLNKKLDEDFPKTAEVAKEIRSKLDAFRDNLPLIKCITSEAIFEEDWNEIKTACGRDDLERDTITVVNFAEFKLHTFLAQIDEITSRAEKKHQLSKKLVTMKAEMKEFKLTLFPYKGKTFVLKAYDDINAKLDDQIVATQAMLGSSNMRGKLKVETRNWEVKLNQMSELIGEIAKCQRTWMYLEPIFASDDIGKTMPNEAAMFKDVDTTWKTTMDAIDSDPGILDLNERDNIIVQFQDANKKLDLIQNKLDAYLEEKSLVFPRFYFLDSQSLLMLLAQTKDPRAVQTHMDKCFEGIAKVQFSDKDEVYGMISAEGEIVALSKKIDVNEGDKKGNVEKWMLEIETQMRKSLRELCRDSLKDYYQTKRDQWVSNWPGQIILAVDQIDWTVGVEDAIKKNSIKEYIEVLNEQIEGIVQQVRGDLAPGLRITLKAMVVIDVHARDVVANLLKKNIQSTNEFEWASQLRYYWTEKDLSLDVSMVTATIPYGWEYLGNSLRLVITPLTDRCYRTLMGAKQLNYGGAPEGPAGTGKTESVKDLAKALAVQCVVFNCSPELGYQAMAKFFKGLASSGCWNCFDEFNRIDLEVLSVIAQQVLTISTAIVQNQRTFVFEGTQLKLNKACSVNITMNPGYAGRSDLPDNLKAQFRPCAMMVPDYVLIGEIELYSFGFSRARYIATKVVASLRLSSEQLSSQDHYDFGMRALKAILTACGNLRRQLDWPEDQLGLRALNDVNLPKFTQNDIPLYNGITSDLFPGVKYPAPDYTLLNDSMTIACQNKNLQPKKEFLNKCIELYETIMVRHGLMVVGGAFSGKSQVIKVLQEAMSTIKDNPLFVNVLCFYINPKSIQQTQLYGTLNADTGEWSDGVLAIKVRDCAESQSPDRKWIIFDGPVDAIWIENMNTVLDDNKKLCLNSGQIIKLKPTMTMMFEVEDLSQASPATVSRCGMVLMEPQQLGYIPLILSYCNNLLTVLEQKLVDKIRNALIYLSDLSMEFVRLNCKFPVPTGPNFLVGNLLTIFDTFVLEFFGEEAKPVPGNIDEICMNSIVFAAIWGVGGQIEETTRPKFDKYLQELISGEDVQEKYKIDIPKVNPMKIQNKVGDVQSLFEMAFIKDSCAWMQWTKTVAQYVVPKDVTYAEVIVPNVDSIRIQYLLNTLLMNRKHTLIVGQTGTGKSLTIGNELKTNFLNERYTFLGLSFSAQTTANQTQQIIDGGMEKKRKGFYGPPLGKDGVVFVDDLNMPLKEVYGAQPPIELLRQWMDYGGWYDIDTPEKDFRTIQKICFAAAMGPPGGGRNSITNRYVRHFNIVYVEPYSDASLNAIFCNVMEWMFRSSGKLSYPAGVEKMKENLVDATIKLYNDVQKRFRPTPAKSHYTFNLRDVSKVFQGLSKSNPRAIQSEDSMTKLWAHECLRVFQDRLISISDRDLFQGLMNEKITEKFKKNWDKLVQIKPLLFASFTPLIYPDNDETKKPFNDIYCELTNRDKVKKICNEGLADYNVMNRSKKMDLVLFTDAIEHIVKIHRVITTQLGHSLLAGVGGSGRKSLTELATFLASYQIETIEMQKGYNFVNWREDMVKKIFMNCGIEGNPLVFLFSDTQIINEAFVEDINNILNNGEIPNLYKQEDIVAIIESVKEAKKSDPDFRNIADDNAAVRDLFVKQAKNSLHLVLAFSPIGDDFKRRLRMFPSLVNCCAIDWFLPWPKEALQEVATRFFSEIEELPARDGVVQICVDMQTRVNELTKRYQEEMRRYYYVTPTSYLILIKTFSGMLDKKRNYIDSQIKKFDRGLDQLAKAAKAVGELQAKLSDLIPVLEVKAANSAQMQKEIEIKKKSVDKEREECKVEEDSAKKQKSAAETKQADCDQALEKVMPIYHEAMKAVDSLSAADVTELKGFKTPPVPAIAVAKTLCMFFFKKPIMIAGPTPGSKVPDYWTTAKKEVLTSDLLKQLQNYKKDEIDLKLVEDMRPILVSPEYSDEALSKASKAAHGIAKWCRAMIQYHDAMKVVVPKKIELAQAKESSAAAQKVWDAAKERLAAVQAEMKKLVDELEATQAEETRLRNEKDDCERKVELAKALIGGLANERENWKIDLQKNRDMRENIVGDILISSGVIAYLGVFLKSYRDECTQSWAEMLMSFQIKSTKNVSVEIVLGDAVKIRQWQIQGLPQDSFSTDSAIISEQSDRWCLFIDPQMQANIWLKNRYREDGLKVIKPTMNPLIISRTLENAIPLGTPVILEDAGETFDPMLDPLLAKQIEKKGSEYYIKFGDQGISFSTDFKFFITTKNSRPHYSPEICVKVTMLNFMVTVEGLLDQMLSIIVRIEEPQKYERRNVCIQTKADMQKKQAELQDAILNLVANSQDDILEDRELKRYLDESKVQSVQIEQTLRDMENTMKQIEVIRDGFTPVAKRVSRLFFVLTDLINVDPMYQYSLEFFRMIYENAIKSVEGVFEKAQKNDRRAYFISEFTFRLYKNVCRSLFEKDKLLFSFLICLKIMDEVQAEQGGLNFAEVRFLMAGATQVELTKPNPAGENGWLSNKSWLAMLEMSTKFKSFAGFDSDFEKYLPAWEKIYNSANPHALENTWPGKWQDISLLHRTIIISILRPDKVVNMIQMIIQTEKEMGEKYLMPPPFDMQEVFADSTNKQPIIIVLSPGADPMTDIRNLSNLKKIKYDSLSLGAGQAEKAVNTIKKAQQTHSWVVLQNCHLAPSFMPTLDAIFEEIVPDQASAFRIWLTTMPSDKFPVTIVQNAIKVTAEPPKGLRNNIRGSYLALGEDELDNSKKPIAFRRLLWGLCFFNALVLERRKFGPLGWNIPYEFSVSDLRISKDQLAGFLDHYEEIPYEALIYMVAEANYGGRVTDPQDRRCIKLILSDYYCAEMINEENHKLSEFGAYFVPPDGSKQDYITFIEENLPINDLTEVFGMHENAEITSAINRTNQILSTALILQPRVSAQAGKTQDQVLNEACVSILEKLPGSYNIEAASKKHPITYENSMNTVLQQELLRFQRLLDIVRSSLQNIGKAIKGEITMSPELEAVGNSIFDNRTPAAWMKRSYPSLKPLASYIVDFVERLNFFQKWIDNGAPSSFWLPGFFFTQSFLTGMKQNYARKYVIAIDEIGIDFEVFSEQNKKDPEIAPADGAYLYGLFLEGCRWDPDINMLQESAPKKLFTSMPYIWFKPAKTAEIVFNHMYTCPIYKTLDRRGVLSTTGHSSNHVCDVELPMQKRHNVKHWVKRGVALVTQLND